MPPFSPRHSRDFLLVALGLTTGATDATVFERLGHVFASVITGNLVLIGVGVVQTDGRLLLFAGCALGGYSLGVLLAASRRTGQDDQQTVWPRSATVALTFDLVLLAAFAVGWEASAARPGRGMQILLLVLAAAAMGVQSTAVRRLGQMSTTYLTSTLTALLEALVVRHWTTGESRGLGIIVMAVVGAAVATVLIDHARAWLPAVQLVPLVLVVALSGRLVGRG